MSPALFPVVSRPSRNTSATDSVPTHACTTLTAWKPDPPSLVTSARKNG